MTLPLFVRYYGKDQPLPEQIPLRAGPLSLIYEAGDLRYIRLGDREIVRRIYVAVRNQNWGTAPAELHNVEMSIGADRFHIRYDVANRLGDLDFAWHGEIEGTPQGTLRLSMDGHARSAFLRNRIGYCVLHPADCAGLPARIEHVDGTAETSRFPIDIAPQRVVAGQIKPVHPFEEMAALAHEVAPGIWAEVRFEGDIFEMEDQRNWTDASFKTYGTPLRLPFPVEIAAGERVHQAITLSVQGAPLAAAARAEEPGVTVDVGREPAEPLPEIGLGVASHGRRLTETEIARLRALHITHLRVDLDLASGDYAHTLQQAAEEARALGVALEVALFVSDRAEAELAGLTARLEDVQPPVARWLVFHRSEPSTTRRWVELARAILPQRDDVRIGAGSNAFFTELNRQRPDLDNLDFVVYSLTPQVHAFDNSSLVETLSAQGVTVASARRFAGGLPVVVSPVTLQPRFNPNATGPEPSPAPGELPSQVDVRQMSLFAAAWTLGSLKYLAESSAAAVTYYETTGWRGVMETEAGSSLPERFRSIPGAVFPVYHVFAAVGEFAGGQVVPTTSSRPLDVEALTLRHAGRKRTLLANLTASPQTATVQGLPDTVTRVTLEADNVEDAMTAPERFLSHSGQTERPASGALAMTLPPYAIVRLDYAVEG